MKQLKLVLLSLFAVSALGAFLASSAFAASILPGAVGTKLTSKSGAAELETVTGGKIKCPSSTGSGEITTKEKAALLLLEFKECTTLGLPVNSLGDKSGIILVHVEAEACNISATQVGLLLEILPVHLEVPIAGVLQIITGDQVVPIETAKDATTLNVTVAQTKGKPAVTGCEGKVEHYTSTENEGTGVEAGESAAAASVTSAVLTEVMA